MLRLASVGSGSKGNATLVATDETTILIDCGFPVREMLVRLPQLGVDISDIDAILFTPILINSRQPAALPIMHRIREMETI